MKKLKKLKKIKIEIPVLKARVLFLIGEYKVLPKRWIKSGRFEDGTYLARCIWKENKNTKWPFQVVIHSRFSALSVLAHEAIHAAGMIQDGMGILPSFENDELTAYLVQYLLEQCEIQLKVYE